MSALARACLDVLDAVDAVDVAAVGASFGEWVAAPLVLAA